MTQANQRDRIKGATKVEHCIFNASTCEITHKSASLAEALRAFDCFHAEAGTWERGGEIEEHDGTIRIPGPAGGWYEAEVATAKLDGEAQVERLRSSIFDPKPASDAIVPLPLGGAS